MAARTTAVPPRWDDTVDAVVVGAGAAGLTAALVAADAGLRVTVLERTALVGGTSAVSGGTLWVPGNRHMAEVGVEDSRADALAYMRAVAGGRADEQVLATLVDRGPEMVEQLERRFGFAFEPYPPVGPTLDYRYHLDGARHGGRSIDLGGFQLDLLGPWAGKLRRGTTSSLVISKAEYYGERHYMSRSFTAPPAADSAPQVGGGAALVAHLLHGCLARGARVLVEQPVEQLVLDDDGAVHGVVVDGRDGRRSLRATHGVVLASGGFEWNEALKARYLDRPLTHPASPEDVGRGDGLELGLAAGAAVAGLGDAWWTPVFDVAGDGAPLAGGVRSVMCRAERGFPHAIVVNRAGRRFVNEATNYYDMPAAFGTLASGPENLPAWLVVDQQFVDAYPLIATKTDGVAPEPARGLAIAGTLAELAARAGIDGAGLEQTVERFNGYARAGRDPDFHRGESAWDRAWGDADHGPNPSLGTIERGPFYAKQVFAGALGTKGGLRIDGCGHVLSEATGAPLAGLFAAGNVAAGSVPWGYTGPGATLGPAMTFGYVIGRELAVAAGAPLDESGPQPAAGGGVA
ncbi:MAG TPA: FAD-dependent oxidoreductase [Conexibacter sp.]|jgi:3-oxosteroid 1-dehydrogenase